MRLKSSKSGIGRVWIPNLTLVWFPILVVILLLLFLDGRGGDDRGTERVGEISSLGRG